MTVGLSMTICGGVAHRPERCHIRPGGRNVIGGSGDSTGMNRRPACEVSPAASASGEHVVEARDDAVVADGLVDQQPADRPPSPVGERRPRLQQRCLVPRTGALAVDLHGGERGDVCRRSCGPSAVGSMPSVPFTEIGMPLDGRLRRRARTGRRCCSSSSTDPLDCCVAVYVRDARPVSRRWWRSLTGSAASR